MASLTAAVPQYSDLKGLISSTTDSGQRLEVQRSYRSNISGIGLFLFAAFLVYLLNIYFYDLRVTENIPLIRHLSLRWLAIIPALMLVELVREFNDDLYIFSLHDITHQHGRLSLSYAVPVIKYVDIRIVQVTQDIFGRIFNYGDIQIGTAGTDGLEISIRGVVDPQQLVLYIDELRTHSAALLGSAPNRGD